jgi:hypothetical protein
MRNWLAVLGVVFLLAVLGAVSDWLRAAIMVQP